MLSGPPVPLPHQLETEIVERKGVGHPDTLADGIAERASIYYSRHCLQEHGAILHHNIDKVAVLGGRARFGAADGEYDRPVRVVFGGRISKTFAGVQLPVRDILERAARDQLREALPGYDRIQLQFRHETTDSSKFAHWFRPRSVSDLPEVGQVRSNDTAYLVGTAPRSAAETVALLTEAWFRQYAWAGSDIKALVVRAGSDWRITACVPALAGGGLETAAAFDDAVREAAGALRKTLAEVLGRGVGVACNTRNTRVEPLSGQYFTVSGSAIDYGEDGLVGRGNARSGVIAGAHMAGNETLFGKNPAYHVGKVGGWLADEAAGAVAAEFGPCRIGLTWANGAAYRAPTSTEITTEQPDRTGRASELVHRALTRTDWHGDLLQGRYLPKVHDGERLLADLDQAARTGR